MSEKNHKFGLYLKQMRKDRDLTMTQLFKLSGVSISYISRLEKGDRKIPAPETLRKLSKALKIDYLELMKQAGHLTKEDSFLFALSPVKMRLLKIVKDWDDDRVASLINQIQG